MTLTTETRPGLGECIDVEGRMDDMSSDVRVHEVDGGSVVADAGGWFPGVYDNAATARHAVTLDIAQVRAVVDECGDRAITMADLEGIA